MPFKSQRQQRFLSAVHPQIAAKFAMDKKPSKKEGRAQAIERRIARGQKSRRV